MLAFSTHRNASLLVLACLITFVFSSNTASAQSGAVRLNPGFEPDPYIVPIMTSGNVDVSRAGLPSRTACVGYTNMSSNFTLFWGGSARNLNIFFIADNGVDATLTIGYQGQEFFCNDNASGLHPGIQFTSTASGQFDIWIGSKVLGEIVSGRLYITEMDLDPASFSMPFPGAQQPQTSSFTQYTPGQIVFAAELYCLSGFQDACALLETALTIVEVVYQQCLSGHREQCVWLDQLVYDYQLSVYTYQTYQQGGRAQSLPGSGPDYAFALPSQGAGSSCPVNDPLLCQLLQETNSAIAGAQAHLDSLDAQGITSFSGGLIGRCQSGDIQACEQYQRRADVMMQAWDYMYGSGSGWAESFSYGN